MIRLYPALTLALLLPLAAAHAASEDTRILFGSCLHQDQPAPILSAINQEQADLFVFLGDNIYGDTTDMAVMKEKYERQKARPAVAALMQSTPTVAIWDDHDYGGNDAGAEYPQKEASRQLMLDFWSEPEDSERRHQPDGIYTTYWLESHGKRIQILLPDLRWNRPALNRISDQEYLRDKKPQNLGPYRPSSDSHESMLGETQWRWLENELLKPADLRILGSSIQLLSLQTGWESWANFPYDRKRLLHLIGMHHINNLIVISGDSHFGEVSKLDLPDDQVLWEVTSSGLTREWNQPAPNQRRVGTPYTSVNYGEIQVNWSSATIDLRLKDIDGKIVVSHQLPLQASGVAAGE